MSTFNPGDNAIYTDDTGSYPVVVIPVENCPPDKAMVQFVNQPNKPSGLVPLDKLSLP